MKYVNGEGTFGIFCIQFFAVVGAGVFFGVLSFPFPFSLSAGSLVAFGFWFSTR